MTFDVPGDGKFKIPNTKEELASFRKKLGAKPGAGFRTEPKRAPHKTPMEKIDGGKASDATIREMLQDGDLTAALELSKVVGRPLVFGAYDATKVDAPLTYTDASPFAPADSSRLGWSLRATPPEACGP
ncbi:MAG: hypothetical protein IPK44_24230 [Candidatus Accumulibacter sp.]|uniref:hypothetical protein n=1 Tax=Accumulibacter sp. TaxID=2053492 RepID=UPI002589D08E|nr:hypothetical protein [Accumulibacter sp.]MBK8117398.1 hypothetical protein [Accumulibacter sp.]